MANDLKGYYNLNNGRELKRLLKEKFNHDFSVTKKGRWFHVNWIDGPGSSAVNDYLNHFNDDGRDDIMTDLWCGGQYIIAQREISDNLYKALLSHLQMLFGWPLSIGDYGIQVDDPKCSRDMAENIRLEFQHLRSIASA